MVTNKYDKQNVQMLSQWVHSVEALKKKYPEEVCIERYDMLCIECDC